MVAAGVMDVMRWERDGMVAAGVSTYGRDAAHQPSHAEPKQHLRTHPDTRILKERFSRMEGRREEGQRKEGGARGKERRARRERKADLSIRGPKRNKTVEGDGERRYWRCGT